MITQTSFRCFYHNFYFNWSLFCGQFFIRDKAYNQGKERKAKHKRAIRLSIAVKKSLGTDKERSDVVIEGCEGEGETVGPGTFVPMNGCDK